MHALFFDGVFIDKDETLRFIRVAAPTPRELEIIAERVMKRTLKYLKKRRMVPEPAEKGAEASDRAPTALESCQRLAMTLGRFARLTEASLAERVSRGESLFDAPKAGARKLAAEVSGFNLEAGVVVRAGDREGLERLCRYILRPTLSLSRMTITPDGLIAYKLKYARKGATHLVLTPLEFLRRVAALIAPPRLVHLRYAGILAPHAKDRKRAAALAVPTALAPRSYDKAKVKAKAEQQPAQRASLIGPESLHAPRDGAVQSPNETPEATAPAGTSKTALGQGLIATAHYIPWADLLKRTYAFDVLACPCGAASRQA